MSLNRGREFIYLEFGIDGRRCFIIGGVGGKENPLEKMPLWTAGTRTATTRSSEMEESAATRSRVVRVSVGDCTGEKWKAEMYRWLVRMWVSS